MTLDILSIPAISADPKYLFSSAKLLISDLHNKLGMDIIKAFESLNRGIRLKDGRLSQSGWIGVEASVIG
jgi:hypothetical protein